MNTTQINQPSEEEMKLFIKNLIETTPLEEKPITLSDIVNSLDELDFALTDAVKEMDDAEELFLKSISTEQKALYKEYCKKREKFLQLLDEKLSTQR